MGGIASYKMKHRDEGWLRCKIALSVLGASRPDIVAEAAHFDQYP